MNDPKDSRLPRGVVYTSGVGRTCPECRRPIAGCDCAKTPAPRAVDRPHGIVGIVRIRRDRKDRRGKTVTILEGLAVAPNELARLASELKRLCGAGGTVVATTIEIQGDHVDRLETELVRRGFPVKRVGG